MNERVFSNWPVARTHHCYVIIVIHSSAVSQIHSELYYVGYAPPDPLPRTLVLSLVDNPKKFIAKPVLRIYRDFCMHGV